MITFTDYANKKNLVKGRALTRIAELEESLTKDNFSVICDEIYRLAFNENPDPDVFTGHKFFKTKVVKETFTREDLMRKGLQPFRMIFARHAEKLRAPGNAEFDNVGLVKYENYLTQEQRNSVLKEIETFPIIENIQPQNSILNNVARNNTPGLYHLIYESDLFSICARAVHRRIMDAKAKDHFLQTSYIQRLQNNPGMNDIQKVCHSDVFFPCLKYWYFPETVTIENGPFNYALNSVQLTQEVLEFWHEESIKIVTDTWDKNRNKGHAEGSLRALPDDLKRMGYELTPITVKQNTLVIANTSGWHCRGDAKKPSIRNAVHGAIRVETPFEVY